MIALFIFLQQSVIDDKIKDAPSSDYQLGVLIGSYIPFILLVAFAYWTYNRAKKHNKND